MFLIRKSILTRKLRQQKKPKKAFFQSRPLPKIFLLLWWARKIISPVWLICTNSSLASILRAANLRRQNLPSTNPLNPARLTICARKDLLNVRLTQHDLRTVTSKVSFIIRLRFTNKSNPLGLALLSCWLTACQPFLAALRKLKFQLEAKAATCYLYQTLFKRNQQSKT